jgi:CxxC motif-containing protein (DUF1111 family)
MTKTLPARAALGVLFVAPLLLAATRAAVEAPAGFDNRSNGLVSQAQFDADRAIFDQREEIDEGLGPVYNAQSCAECHQNPVSGAGSQVNVLRVGRFDGGRYSDRPGGSLIHDRSIVPEMQERVTAADNVRTFRASLSLLGDGYVEAIDDAALVNLQNRQPPQVRGTILRVPVGEAGGALRIGRFGWKNQHASLLSFSADAYLNEMGITSPLQPDENTSNGTSVAAYDTVADPEEPASAAFPAGEDVEIFARFMRALPVPPRDLAMAATPDSRAGEQLFQQIGCATCHTPSITTAPAGTPINGGTFVVPPALGDKVIHPYGDFLLHDVGTGDGIVQNGGPATRNLIRTPPLWGLRTRDRLMHDGLTLTRHDAVMRHRGQAGGVVNRYNGLSLQQKNQLMTFLSSL